MNPKICNCFSSFIGKALDSISLEDFSISEYRSVDIEVRDTDVLIIGGGVAGCRAALEASNNQCQVTLVCREIFGKSQAVMASDGVNAALEKPDSWKAHFFDTMKAGEWLNNQQLVSVLTKETPSEIDELEKIGLSFDRDEKGVLKKRTLGKQSFDRALNAHGSIGREMIKVLSEAVLRAGVELREEAIATSLIVRDDSVEGATILDFGSGNFSLIKSKSTIIATGGFARIYEASSNAEYSIGGGHAMAYRAGAELVDMEMIQFHPLGRIQPESQRGLIISNIALVLGGILLTKTGEPFMQKYDAGQMEMAGDHEVSKAILDEAEEGTLGKHGGAFLDLSHLSPEVLEAELGPIFEQCLRAGVDLRKEAIEVFPTAHASCGGIAIDENGQTSVQSLFAVGDMAGGIHGSNRLAGNALSAALVFGKRAGHAAAQLAKKRDALTVELAVAEGERARIFTLLDSKEGKRPITIKRRIQSLLWNNVGVIRSQFTLTSALSELVNLGGNGLQFRLENQSLSYNREWADAIDVLDMRILAEIVARSAQERTESRGCHFRRDATKTDNQHWLINIYTKNVNTIAVLDKREIKALYAAKPVNKIDEIRWS